MLEKMEEPMDVLEDNRIYTKKYVPLIIFGLISAIRFLTFYNIPGMVMHNGWIAPIENKAIYILGFLLFIVGVWCRHRIWRFALEELSVLIMLLCECLFIKNHDFLLKWLSYGFLIFLCLILVLVSWFAYVFRMTKCNTS